MRFRLAGMWSKGAVDTGFVEELTDADIADGLNAAASIGDDRIQQQVKGQVDPETWTHGSAQQRQRWFPNGYRTGTLAGCDTFAARGVSLLGLRNAAAWGMIPAMPPPSHPGRARAAAFLAALTCLALLAGGSPVGAEGSGPALTTDVGTLASALTCRTSMAAAGRNPVILVHGTSSTVNESFRSGFVFALNQAGYPVCTVDLPHRAMADIQQSAEYVVYAIREVSSLSGRQVSVVGHSQGGIQALWALRYWPDLRSRVTDVIGMGTPYGGTVLANTICHPSPGCTPAIWQMTIGSALLAKATAGPLPEGPAYTSIGSLFDEISAPAPSATKLDGATNVFVQDLCPGRPVDHLTMLYDAATFALVLDAIDHDGPAEVSRVAPAVCTSVFIPTDVINVIPDSVSGIWNFALVPFTYPLVDREPDLRPYAS